jgi:hypothetical protein
VGESVGSVGGTRLKNVVPIVLGGTEALNGGVASIRLQAVFAKLFKVGQFI